MSEHDPLLIEASPTYVLTGDDDQGIILHKCDTTTYPSGKEQHCNIGINADKD
jgi:hypothetical protein